MLLIPLLAPAYSSATVVSANSPAGRVCSAVPTRVAPERAVTRSTSPLKMFRMLVASKIMVQSSVISNMPKTSIRIIRISTSNSERDVRPSAVDVNLHLPSCFVSHDRDVIHRFETLAFTYCFANSDESHVILHFYNPSPTTGGPTQIDCKNGRCTNYTTDDLNCGTGIEAASEAYGSFQIPLTDGDQVYSLYGFEGINNIGTAPVQIPSKCNLDCSGCRQYVKKQNRRLGSDGNI